MDLNMETTEQRKSSIPTPLPKGLTIERKYELYEASVQNPENEVEFIQETFEKLRGRVPRKLREDFCGTGGICAEWVKAHPENKAVGLDLDPEPVEYGKKHHWGALNEDQQGRMEYLLQDVFHSESVQGDAICAYNFSYFGFKTREELRAYFKAVREALPEDGLFFLDIFGGPESMQPLEEETEHDDFSYFWDCVEFSPVTHACRFAIHFKEKGKKKIKNVFTYEWRFWTLPEVREILAEAGFKSSTVYWEGDDGEGGGNGEFAPTDEGEPCDAWVSYIVAEK